MPDLKLTYETYIRTTPEGLWEALTRPELTVLYDFGSAVESDWQPGSPIVYRMSGGTGSVSVRGTLVDVQPPARLVHIWEEVWNPESAGDRPSRVTYAIEPMGEVCKLTVVHEEFGHESQTYRMVASAWPMILSGLKTVLETGQPLPLPIGG